VTPEGDGGVAFHRSSPSSGVVERAVRVVMDPRAAQLAPREILVCLGADPLNTLLSLAARGPVMEAQRG
jgi:hypothetical protein